MVLSSSWFDTFFGFGIHFGGVIPFLKSPQGDDLVISRGSIHCSVADPYSKKTKEQRRLVVVCVVRSRFFLFFPHESSVCTNFDNNANNEREARQASSIARVQSVHSPHTNYNHIHLFDKESRSIRLKFPRWWKEKMIMGHSLLTNNKHNVRVIVSVDTVKMLELWGKERMAWHWNYGKAFVILSLTLMMVFFTARMTNHYCNHCMPLGIIITNAIHMNQSSSQTCGPVLVGQINDSRSSPMVSVCLSFSSLLFTDLLCAGILYRCLRLGNLPLEQLYCLFVTPRRPQRRPGPSNDRAGGQRISAICSTSSRIQVLAGVYKGYIYFHSHDLFFGLWHSSFLADPAHVLFRPLFHDDEATNHAHVQTQVRANQLGKIKVQGCWNRNRYVRWRHGQIAMKEQQQYTQRKNTFAENPIGSFWHYVAVAFYREE